MMMSMTPTHAPLPPLKENQLVKTPGEMPMSSPYGMEENQLDEDKSPPGILMDNPYGDIGDSDSMDEEDDDICFDDGSKALSVLNELSVLEEDHPISFINADPMAPVPVALRMEDILTNEMEKLSFEEKEKAVFDVHGFCNGLKNPGTAIAEATEEEEEKLVKLDKELKKLKVDPSNTLVQQKEFRLMFLRCEDLDVKVAALRIVNNIKTKTKLFGAHTADRRLEHSDLDEDDLRVLDSNFIKICPHKDTSGRFVLIHVPDTRPANVTQLNCFKAMFYLFSKLAQDPQVQRQGFAFAALFNRVPGKKKKEAVSNLKFVQKLKAGLPHKVTAAHVCLDTGTSNPDHKDTHLTRVFVTAVQLILKPSMRERFRAHVGLRETIHFQMQSYGIFLEEDYWPTMPPPPLLARLPSADTSCTSAGIDDSETSFGTRSSQMEPCAVTSQMEPCVVKSGPVASDAVVLNPTDKDVLLGRGKHTRNHPGNLNATDIVNAHRKEYEKAKKFEKTAIAMRIVHVIQAQGGRFLKEEKKGEWYSVDNQIARNKISHLYRNTKKSFFGFK